MCNKLLCNNNLVYLVFLAFYIMFVILCNALLSMPEEKGDINPTLRSLQIVGLNLLTYKLWLRKLLSPPVELQEEILYSGRSASTNAI